MRTNAFESQFERAARVVRRALALGHVLDALTVGALAGLGAAGVAWALRAPWFLTAALSVTAAALLYGAARAVSKRWSDANVALFLDARLGSKEAVSTALEWIAKREPEGGEASVTREITRAAESALAGKPSAALRPRVTRRAHASLPVLAPAILALAFVPPRTPAEGAGGPPKDVVNARLEGLRKVEPLRALAASESEKKRLEALAEAARQLAADAERGLERKAALDRLDKLRARALEERKVVPDAARRAGIDAAAKALARHAETAAAARALERTDLVSLDKEMERLANTLEARSREIAEQALLDAAAAARAGGAEGVAEALEEQHRLLKKRSADSEAMRELARLLGEKLPAEGARQLERLNRGDAEAGEALAQAMVDALKGLGEDERRRIAESLRQAADGMQGGRPMTAEQMKALAKALSNADGQKQLQEALKQMASRDPSAEAAREAAVSAALLGIGEAQLQLSSGQGGQDGPAGAPGNTPGGERGPGDSPRGGPSPNGGPGSHRGSTPEVAASAVPAHAAGTAFGGIPMGRAPGTSPGVAGAPRGALGVGPGAARPGDVAPVTRTDVPKEYRDQVGRYFAP